eukprot:m.9507 g.9507  ORF g.9507 m.9507 type:complete len:53 (+) comp5460_c0_seq1:4154-4312(+)
MTPSFLLVDQHGNLADAKRGLSTQLEHLSFLYYLEVSSQTCLHAHHLWGSIN